MSNAAAPDERPRIPHWTLGERMAKARESAGKTQAEMAAEFDVAAVTVSSWETMSRQPKKFFEKLRRWAEITNVDYVWLVTGGDTESSHLLALLPTIEGQLDLDSLLPADPPELSLV